MLKTLEVGDRRLLVLFLTAFMVFGAAFTVIGAALPEIIRTFQWSYTLTGVVLGASAVGYFVASFLCGFLVERFSPRRVLVVGLLVGCAGMALFARTPSPWLNLLLCLAIGLCQGAIEVVTNLGVVRMEKNGQSRLMNLVHAFFCIGAIAGPVAVGALVGGGLRSSISVFAVSGGMAALLALLFGLSRFPPSSAPAGAERGSTRRLLAQPLLLLFTLFLMLYVGAELGVSTWVSEYFVTVLGSTASTGAYSVSLFWAGLLAGRLFISFAYHGQRQERIVLALACIATAALLLTQSGRSVAVVAVGIFLTGLGLSGIYPLVMAMVGKAFKTGVAIGTAATGGGIGSFTFPFLMAVMAQRIGMRGGFWFYTGLTAALALLSFVIARRMRSAAAA
jgi:fucose permease